MRAFARAAGVIARRDYIATVWSRAFLIFLAFPLVVWGFSIGMGVLAAREGRAEGPAAPALVRVAMDATSYTALVDARDRLARRLGTEALPELTRDAPAGTPVLLGTLDHPHLAAPDRRLRALAGDLGVIVDAARDRAALGARAPAPARLVLLPLPSPPARDSRRGRIAVGQGGQFALFFHIMMLSGMMVSNLVEEKSSKIIELLLAAVPVDAVFAGKLAATLGVSLTGVAVWGTVAALGALAAMPAGALPTPAVGWPMFLALGFAYYVTAFCLLGGLYLGVGAQAASVREVQTLSLPLSLGQLAVLGLASASVARPDGALGLFAAAVPWSSPYAMLARAAVDARLWPHLLGLAWQTLAVIATVRLGARLFRTNILSGRPRRTRAA